MTLVSWCLLILVYGIFTPNTGRRAAVLLLPLSAIPLAIVLVAGWRSDEVARELQAEALRIPWAMPLIAAGIAIYAAHVDHATRREAFEARKFGQYVLREKLGEGGMGEVFRAEHRLLKRPCALKRIRAQFVADPRSLARFEREVTATARLTHWNSIQVYDCGRSSDGAFYYVMELLEGLNLGDLVRQFGPLSPARAVHFLRQTCCALNEAHANGLIHRDIKPENIFAARIGGVLDVAKLLDFGVVREAFPEQDPHLTAKGTLVGTLHYMSPEQASGSPQVTPRADLYALGAVAYFLLTGNPPFVRERPLDVLVAHARDEVTPPSRVAAGIPADLEQVVLRCLAKRPEDRFASASEVEQALAACGCADQWSQEQAAAWWEHEMN